MVMRSSVDGGYFVDGWSGGKGSGRQRSSEKTASSSTPGASGNGCAIGEMQIGLGRWVDDGGSVDGSSGGKGCQAMARARARAKARARARARAKGKGFGPEGQQTNRARRIVVRPGENKLAR